MAGPSFQTEYMALSSDQRRLGRWPLSTSGAGSTGGISPVAAAPVSTPAPIPSTTPASTELPPLDVRIATFVDNVHVTGIRASGTGSKVLMNDKVYRLGDVVDRLLGLRLVKIEPDSLTFADVNGTLYTKNF